MNIYNITATLNSYGVNDIKDISRQVVANDATHAAFQAGQFHDIDIDKWELVYLYVSNVNPVSGDVYEYIK